MPDWVFQMAGYLFAGGMAYGAIRIDLRTLHDGVRDARESARNAHRRLDDHVDAWHRHNRDTD